MPKSILLLQDPNELDLAKDFFKDKFSQLIVLAWTPFVINKLREEKIAFKTLSDFTDEEFPKNKVLDNALLYKNWSELIDREIARLIPEIRELGIKPFTCKFLAWRKLFFIHYNEYEKVLLVLRKLNPEKIYYFSNPEVTDLILLRIFNLLKEDIKRDILHPIPSAILYKDFVDFKKPSSVPMWYTESKFHKLCLQYLKKTHRYKDLKSLVAGISKKNIFKKGDNVLVFFVDWDLGEYINVLKKEKLYNFVFWEDLSLNFPIDPLDLRYNALDIMKQIEKISEHHPWIVREGANFLKIFTPWIMKFLEVEIPKMILTAKKFLKLQQIYDFKLVVSSYSLTECDVVFSICDKMLIPSTVFLHGGTIGLIDGFPPMSDLLRDCQNKMSYLLTYADGVNRFCEKLRISDQSYHVQNVPVGSIYYESLMIKGRNLG